MAPLNPAHCLHPTFIAMVDVFRLSESDNGPVTGYTAEVTIKCDACGIPFRFIGIPPGNHPTSPRVSADALELRAPLEPAIVREILGIPERYGNA